jgi:hypothetical protein
MKKRDLKIRTIWNSHFNTSDYTDYIVEEHPEAMYDDDLQYQIINDLNILYLDDEKCNLDKPLGNKIIIIADLGFWDGRKLGYRIVDANLNKIFDIGEWDEAHWYYDRYNIHCRNPHHDGVHYLKFRELKDNKYEEIICEKIYNGTLTSKDITRYTKSLVPYIKEIYGV